MSDSGGARLPWFSPRRVGTPSSTTLALLAEPGPLSVLDLVENLQRLVFAQPSNRPLPVFRLLPVGLSCRGRGTLARVLLGIFALRLGPLSGLALLWFVALFCLCALFCLIALALRPLTRRIFRVAWPRLRLRPALLRLARGALLAGLLSVWRILLFPGFLGLCVLLLLVARALLLTLRAVLI